MEKVNYTIYGPRTDQYKLEFHMNGWNTPPDYFEYVHPHWRSFPAPNPFMHHMLGVFYILFCIASLCGNGVVIWIFTTTKSLRTPSNLFVVNLAIMDFLMMAKTPIFISNSFAEGPIWGNLGCQIFGIMGSFTGIGSAAINTAIAYDRYRTIAKPFDGKLTQGKAIIVILLVWLWALPFTIMPALEVWGRFVPEGYLTSCSFDYLTETTSIKAFVGCIFVWSYCIPLSMTMYFYSQIVGHVSNHEKLLREQVRAVKMLALKVVKLRGGVVVVRAVKVSSLSQKLPAEPPPILVTSQFKEKVNYQFQRESFKGRAKKMNVESLRGNKDQAAQSAEIRIAKVAIGILCLYLLSWTPYAIVALTACFGNRELITPLVSMIPALTCKTVACLDPWVYAINHPKYRVELQKRMPWFCIHEPDPPPDAAVSETTTKA